MMKPKFKLAAICALSALTACRTAHVGSSGGGGTLSAEVQYCASSGNAGDETVEVLVRNGTDSPVEFVRAELDGTELPRTASSAAKALKAFSFEGVGGKAKSRMSAQSPVAGARWWQLYPSPRIEVGGAAVSEKHAGFVVNLGGATAADVQELLKAVSDKVFDRTGIRLEPEVRIW